MSTIDQPPVSKDIPNTMPYTSEDKALAREFQAENSTEQNTAVDTPVDTPQSPVVDAPPPRESFLSKYSTKQKVVATLAALGFGGSTYLGVQSIGNEPVTITIDTDKSTSGPAVAGDTPEKSDVKIAKPNTETETMPYAEAKEKAGLSPDQKAAWESGDETTRNDIASDVLAPRLEVALFQVEDAMKKGARADISQVTSDSDTLYPYIENVLNEFPLKDSEKSISYHVCRTNLDYSANYVNCDPFYNSDKSPNMVANETNFVILRNTDDNFNIVPEVGSGQVDPYTKNIGTQFRVELVGDTLELVPITE